MAGKPSIDMDTEQAFKMLGDRKEMEGPSSCMQYGWVMAIYVPVSFIKFLCGFISFPVRGH